MAQSVSIVAGDNAQTPLFPTAASISDAAQIYRADSFLNIAAGATTVVKSGAGSLAAIVVNNPGTTITVTVYDNTSAASTKIATILLAAGMVLRYDVAFGTGLTVVTSGTCDITVVYR